MTSSVEVLAELRAHGVELFRNGDRVGLRPARAVPPDLLARARAIRDDLLRLVRETAPPPDVPDPVPGPFALRVVRDAIHPRPSPFELSYGVSVVDSARCIKADLAELEAVIAEYGLVWGGPDENPRLAQLLGDRIEVLLDRLEACGARVRVVAVS